ncbi:MAG: protoporphyrinogen oxidase [Planctomycetota bacterium]|jgi:oxygen-dependent protoporphyrinogen oxidase
MIDDVLVVGAGPAGLAYSHRRVSQDQGLRLRILERGPEQGGHVRTRILDGYTLEWGPQAIRPTPDFYKLTEDLGLAEDLIPAADHAKKRWIAKRGKLCAFPAGPVQAIRSDIMPLMGKLRVLREPWIAKAVTPGESVASFVERRLGSACVPLIQAVINGIYAGDVDKLEVEATLPFLAKAEAEHGSLFRALLNKRKQKQAQAPAKEEPKQAALYSFSGGMHRLTDSLTSWLGDRVLTNQEITAIDHQGSFWEVSLASKEVLRARELVLAAPAFASAELLADFDPELARELAAIPFAPVASAYLGYAKKRMGRWEDGFGFLLHPMEQQPVLGAIYCSSLFPEQAPRDHSLIRVMMGGSKHPDLVQKSDAELVDLAHRTLENYVGVEGRPAFSHVTKISRAIPQYNHGHSARMRRVATLMRRHPGLDLRGNSYLGIALGAQLSCPEFPEDAAQQSAEPEAMPQAKETSLC